MTAIATSPSHAWPVLRAASVPATMFVATGADDPSTPFWWDRLWAAVQGAPGPAPIATPLGALPVGAEHARRTVATIRDWLKTLDHDEAMREVDRIVEELGARDGRDGTPIPPRALRPSSVGTSFERSPATA